jgi:hypothetical protein
MRKYTMNLLYKENQSTRKRIEDGTKATREIKI